MTPESLLWTVFAALIVSTAGTFALIVAGRRYGIGALAQTVDKEQADLIQALRDGRAEDREEVKQLKDELHESERKRKGCEAEIALLKRNQRLTDLELLELYRRLGQEAPHRLEVREQRQGTKQP